MIFYGKNKMINVRWKKQRYVLFMEVKERITCEYVEQ
jgi:hypothetical protein